MSKKQNMPVNSMWLWSAGLGVVIGGAFLLFLQDSPVRQETSIVPKPRVVQEAQAMVAQVGISTLAIKPSQKGETVTIDEVVLDKPGFVVIRDQLMNRPGVIVGISALLPKGSTKDVAIDIARTFETKETFYAQIAFDTGDRSFQQLDDPVLRADDDAILSVPFSLEGSGGLPGDVRIPQ